MTPTALDKRTAVATSTSPVKLSDPTDTGRVLKLAYAERWKLWIAPTTQNITLIRYRTRGQTDWPWESWITAEDDAGTDITATAGEATSINVAGDCAYELDVEVTAAGVGTCALYVAGV